MLFHTLSEHNIQEKEMYNYVVRTQRTLRPDWRLFFLYQWLELWGETQAADSSSTSSSFKGPYCKYMLDFALVKT